MVTRQNPHESQCTPAEPQEVADGDRAVAGAEDRAEMIDVLVSVDDYVDPVLEAS